MESILTIFALVVVVVCIVVVVALVAALFVASIKSDSLNFDIEKKKNGNERDLDREDSASKS